MTFAALAALFAAGLLTFASPCVLPLLPMYVSVLGGASAGAGDERVRQSRMRRAGIGFAVGLAVVFVVLGFGASLAASALSEHRRVLLVIAGALLVLFGLKLVGILRIGLLDAEARPLLRRVPGGGGFLGGLLFGAAFGLGWTPCVGPVLGAALTYAASASTHPLAAAAQLAAYATGLAAPLVLAAFAAPRVLAFARRMRGATPWFQRATGVLLIAVGALLAADRLGSVMPTASHTALATEPAACTTGSGGACAAPATVAGAPAGAAVRGRPRMLEFVSSHCEVCARMAPVVADLERRCGQNGAFLRVDIDAPEGRALAARYGVRLVPTFLSVDAEGAEVERIIGEQTPERLAVALGEVRGDQVCREAL